jgi:TRAP-type C4-dicarboxylate transport system substrate-binding protein
VEKDFQECAFQNAQEVIAAQADLIQTLKDNGMEIVEVDKEVFKEAAKNAYEALGWTELRETLYKEAGLQ